MSNTSDKLSILDSFIEEVNSYLPEIEANLERLAEASGDMDALEETYRRTHTIGGSASMMDFPGLSHVAHGMEDILGDVMDGLATLDPPTIGLLQRSLGRLHKLLAGIHSGIDQEAVIAEDDEDYTRYRMMIEAAEQAAHSNGVASGTFPTVAPTPSTAEPSIPSLDEVLASFRTPSISEGEEIEWPEDPVQAGLSESEPVFPAESPVASTSTPQMPTAQQPAQPTQPTQPAQPAPVPESVQTSALDMLVATTRQTAPQTAVPAIPATPLIRSEDQLPPAPAPVPASKPVPATAAEKRGEILPAKSAPVDGSFLQSYGELQNETQALEVQASSLKNLVVQLRSAVEVIEAQRTEFKGFLDGSKDALDRMEDWAGKAMGLNLRNSPEQVRRYLPLSVMWVSNSKLKKVLELLTAIISGAQMTDEQVQDVVQQLRNSLISCGVAFQQLQAQAHAANPVFKQEPGWTPWEMQLPQETNGVRERVTFERLGDITAIRAQIEAQLQGDIVALRTKLEREIREELRQEYEARPLPLAARAELEQQIRNEVRQEFEARRQLQAQVSGSQGSESLYELETRLRSEIEIQVRQEFLNQITELTGCGAGTPSLMPPTTAPRTSNFLDQAREATGMAPAETAIPSTSVPPVAPTAPMLSASVTPAPHATAPVPAPLSTGTPASSSTAFSSDFVEEAAEIFRVEAEEHLQTISMYVAALEKDPENRELIQGVRRAIHTLKGAAGMMGFRAIADLSHVSEDLLDSIMEGTTSISPTVLSLILDTAETLDMLISNLGSSPEPQEARVEALRARYIAFLGERSTRPDTLEEEIDSDLEANDEAMHGAPGVAGVVAGGQTKETNAQRAARGDLSVRVRLQKLDELVNLFGELLVNRTVLEERIERLLRLITDAGMSSNRLRDIGQKLESRFEAATLPSGHSVSVMPGEGNGLPGGKSGNAGNNGNSRVEASHIAEFDELELDRYTEFHQLARGLSECVSDMTTLSTEMEAVIRECEGVFSRENRLSTTFQDRLMKARLVPLSSMTPRLYRAAKAVALKQHKEFEFLLEGEETEVDRTVYEEIAGPLLHLMRNAVNHALETPEERVAQGKSPAGHITLSAAYEGNQVVITVKDDGTGIDPNKVRAEAIARSLLRPDQALSDGDVLELIFRPGFSTAGVVSEESGRGVGLDVVRDSVARLRGTLAVDSAPGQGTSFTMKFPTSLAIQSAMMVTVSGQQFAIPTVIVDAIGRLDGYKQTVFGGRPAVVVQNDIYPLSILAQHLNLPVEKPDEKAPLLLINTGEQRVALIVNEIKGKMDVVMKNLGPHLREVHGVAGGTVLGNGRVVLILELIELLSTRKSLSALPKAPVPVPASAQSEPAQALQTAGKPVESAPVRRGGIIAAPPVTPAQAARGKHILVVDDSPSVRRVVSNMLKQHGWETQMARDGVEALELISQQAPAAVLLDIEMPRMDGYELMATIRAQEQYRTLPLVVLTSRAAAKHQQRAMQIGANGYVVKPYQDEELINILNTLVYGTTV